MSPAPEGYTDCWTPIESNPEVFTELAHSIGLSESLAFQDIWTLDQDSIAFLPRPVYALVLVFPTDDDYEQNKLTREVDQDSSTSEKVIWFKQTIYNACGLYGLLHAVCNGEARNHIYLKREYLKAAQDGDSTVPLNAGDDVDFHYTCFAKSEGHLLELDGDLAGPVDLGVLNEDEDVMSETALEPVRRFMQANGRGNIGFSMLALVRKD